MAIRLRTVNGIRVALCAAESDAVPGDLYLDDADHHALSNKFGLDWQAMGFIANPPIDEDVAAMMATQKLRDAKEAHAAWSAAMEGRAKGGRARAASLSPTRRTEIAKAAAKARWNRTNGGPPL